MPSPGVPAPPRLPIEDSYFELFADTLESLDLPARGQFLQRYFRALAHVDLRESQSVQIWDEMVSRRRELTGLLGRQVSLKTALTDVLSSSGFLRVPILLEYEALKNLHRNPITDPLTGLYNRRLFAETFEKELNRARRYTQPLGLVTLDLHRFKEVNDKHGHPRGDDVLRAAAATLKKALRTSDSAFRIGGDEFALVLPQTDSAQASALSRRVGVVFAEIILPLELTISVTMDHGVSTYPQDGEQREQLIRVADERLYGAKQDNYRRADAEAAPPSAEAHATDRPGEPPRSGPSATEPAVPPAEPPIEISAAPQATVPVPEPPVSPAPTAPEVASPASPPPSVSPLQTSRPSFPVAPEEPQLYTVPRKAERVSMAGTNAYAVLGDQPSHRARVVDLGFGGVALDFPSEEGIPDTLLAVLHVPILPPVRVNLKRVWTKQLSENTVRVGCCFVS